MQQHSTRTLAAIIRSLSRKVFGSFVHDRLAGEIESVRSDLENDLLEKPDENNSSWSTSARNELHRAVESLRLWDIENGWDAVHAARRFQLANPLRTDRLELLATALRLEAQKVDGWRGKAILLILGEAIVPNVVVQGDPARVLEAMKLRDQASQNIWFKIALRRRDLRSLFIAAWLAVGLCLILSWFGRFDYYLGDFNQVAAAALFGTLGGIVGVAKSLVVDKVTARIPAQRIGAFVVWMRPGLGAAAALVVIAAWKAGVDSGTIQHVAAERSTAIDLAFLAGFSEQVLVGALGRIARESDFSKSPET